MSYLLSQYNTYFLNGSMTSHLWPDLTLLLKGTDQLWLKARFMECDKFVHILHFFSTCTICFEIHITIEWLLTEWCCLQTPVCMYVRDINFVMSFLWCRKSPKLPPNEDNYSIESNENLHKSSQNMTYSCRLSLPFSNHL